MKSKYDEEKEAIKSTLKNKAKESLAKEIKKTSFEDERRAFEDKVQRIMWEEIEKSKDGDDFEF